MRKFNKATALLLTVAILFTSAVSITASAHEITKEDWNTYWANDRDEIEAAVMLTPRQ